MTGVEALLLALAGGCGAATRFLVDSWVTRHSRSSVPLGTLVVNASACLLIGLVAGWSLHAGGSLVPSVASTGFLGGYSTFSTASVEGARLLLAGRPLAGLLHAGGMLVVCVLAALVGVAVTAP